MTSTLLALLLLTTTAHAASKDTLPPGFQFALPTALEVGLRVPLGSRCTFVAGRTATQPERFAMLMLTRDRLWPDVLRAAKHLKGCENVDSSGNYQAGRIRLDNYYRSCSRAGGYPLMSPTACDTYDFARKAFQAFHDCVLKTPQRATACAQSLDVSGDVLDATDLHIDAGKCAPGARAILTLPGYEDPQLRDYGQIDCSVPVPQTPAFQAVVATIVAQHHASDHAWCLGEPFTGSVGAATRQALLAPGLVPIERWAALLVFTGGLDDGAAGWSRQDICDFKMLEGLALGAEWGGRCLTLGGTAVGDCMDMARSNHNGLHDCAAYKADTLVRFGTDAPRPQFTGGKQRTCADWLRCQTGELPGCRLKWVPAPETWRVLVAPDGVR